MERTTLLLMSTALILAVVAHGRSKKFGFDMLDSYFLMIMLYLGVYSAIDALINKSTGEFATTVMLTFVLIMLAMLVTFVFYLILPLRFRQVLRFDFLMEQWVNINHKSMVLLAVLYFLVNAYVFFEFGLLTYVGKEIELLNISVPTWIGPLKNLLNVIGYAIYVFIVSSILKQRIKVLSIFGLVMLVLVIMLSLEGRRAFIELVVITFVLWSCSRRKNVYSYKHILHTVILLVVYVAVSNVYQTYRQEFLSIQSRVEEREVSSILTAVGNFDATIENIRKRTAMWKYNYIITTEQVERPQKIFFGELARKSFINSVPSVIFESKNIFDVDAMVAEFYGFYATDYPANNFASFLADFGVLMVVILPVINILVLTLVPYYYFSCSKNRTLFLLVSVMCLQYLSKIENSYGDIFILFRNILLLTGVFLILNIVRRVFSTNAKVTFS